MGRWETPDGEEIVVCRHSETRVEIHCHGGPAAAGRIVDGLVAAGCRQATWSDWVRHTAPDRFAAAAAARLPLAKTQRTASILLDQYQGAFRVNSK